jgi:predicted metal-dependent enzyme (double-stranded beta helix superfamily)
MDALFHLLDAAAILEPRDALRECPPLLRLLSHELTARVEGASRPGSGWDPEPDIIAQRAGWSLELFRWPRGARTPIHDHTSWGIYVCLVGQLGEERYTRLDDGSHDGVARLRSVWKTVWLPEQQSTLLPYDGGIHRVRNAGLTTAVSLHLYGPRISDIDGRDYDLTRDYVCDRALAA